MCNGEQCWAMLSNVEHTVVVVVVVLSVVVVLVLVVVLLLTLLDSKSWPGNIIELSSDVVCNSRETLNFGNSKLV